LQGPANLNPESSKESEEIQKLREQLKESEKLIAEMTVPLQERARQTQNLLKLKVNAQFIVSFLKVQPNEKNELNRLLEFHFGLKRINLHTLLT